MWLQLRDSLPLESLANAAGFQPGQRRTGDALTQQPADIIRAVHVPRKRRDLGCPRGDARRGGGGQMALRAGRAVEEMTSSVGVLSTTTRTVPPSGS